MARSSAHGLSWPPSSPVSSVSPDHLRRGRGAPGGVGHQAAWGTPGEFDALCKWSRAERELKEYEAKLARLSELRAELSRRKAGQPSGTAG